MTLLTAFAALLTQVGEASTIFPVSSHLVCSYGGIDAIDAARMCGPDRSSSTVTAMSISAPVEKKGSENFVSPAEMAGASSPPPEFRLRRWRTDHAVIMSTIYEAGALIADGITTVRIHGGAVEAGSAWAYGTHPTAARVSAMMAAEFMGVEASSYLLHKMRAPRWIYIAPMIGSGSYHLSGAIENISLGQ